MKQVARFVPARFTSNKVYAGSVHYDLGRIAIFYDRNMKRFELYEAAFRQGEPSKPECIAKCDSFTGAVSKAFKVLGAPFNVEDPNHEKGKQSEAVRYIEQYKGSDFRNSHNRD